MEQADEDGDFSFFFFFLPRHITPAAPCVAVPTEAIQEGKHPWRGGHFYSRPLKTFLIITFPHFSVCFEKIYQPVLRPTQRETPAVDTELPDLTALLHLLTHFSMLGSVLDVLFFTSGKC